MIRNIIFDVGKVLVDYDPSAYLKAYDFTPEEESAIYRVIFAAPVWDDLDRGVKPVSQIREECAAQVIPEYRDDLRHAFDQYSPSLTKLDYAIPWIEELKGRGFHVYYLSNYSDWMVEKSRPALDFLPYTDGGLFSYEVKQIKPEAEIFYSLIARFPAIVPEESVFLDDKEPNVRTAVRLGFRGIVFRDYEQGTAELERILSEQEH